MNQIQSHFQQNAHHYKIWLVQAGKGAIGIAMVGVTLCCLHLLRFLYNIYQLPRDSREYLYKREHIEGENLIRYIITVLCILIIDCLIAFYFDQGPYIILVGMASWVIILLAVQIYNMVKSSKDKAAKQK